MQPSPSVLLNHAAIQQALSRIAREITEKNQDRKAIVLIGIQRGGVQIAERLSDLLQKLWGDPVLIGALDVSMHRDDLDQRVTPDVHPTRIPFDITGKTVILVDDVLFRGRTARAALDALNDFGRARAIQLAVLIDRGHRELPIKADFVGKKISTSLSERINVLLSPKMDEEKVLLEKI